MDILKALYDLFPTAVHTGTSLVFVSDEWKVVLWEYTNPSFGAAETARPVIRARFLKKALTGDYVPDHYQDFVIGPVNELANQIERYIQFSIGKNFRENP